MTELTQTLHHLLLEDVTRVEIIDNDGRAYGAFNLVNGIILCVQDDQRTLKVFIEKNDASV
jgi:hypothetical protein